MEEILTSDKYFFSDTQGDNMVVEYLSVYNKTLNMMDCNRQQMQSSYIGLSRGRVHLQNPDVRRERVKVAVIN